MIPQITAYTCSETTNEDAQLIRLLTNAGFTPLVDSLHKNQYQWFMSRYKTNYRIFLLTPDELHMGLTSDLHKDMFQCPSFTVAYNDSDYVSDHDWRFIHRYFEHVLYPCSRKPKLTSRRAHQLLNLPTFLVASLVDAPPETEKEYYTCEKKVIEDRNLLLVQVNKPYTDRPYTAVIRDFQQRGMRPFFTALFVSNSWGLCQGDIDFLKNYWDAEMDGDFDLERMLKEDTEACYPSATHSPRGEPEVYRKSILETLATLKDKEEGRLFKTT